MAFGLSSDVHAQYGVSGVVSFSYEDYSTKIGSQKQSSQTFSQIYALSLSNYIWDRRFMTFSAGVGYTDRTKLNDAGADTQTLTYGLSTTFFPGRSISMDLFGNKAINKIESRSNLAGYNVTSTAYGATMMLSLNTLNKNGNRNNNNNNNNNGFNGNWGRRAVLPDIVLSHIHTDSESQNASFPIRESRDDSKVLLTYRPSTRFDMSLDGELEQYKNELTGYFYDSATAGMRANAALSPRSALSMYGRYTDRTMSINSLGGDPELITYSYGMTLDTVENARLSHKYQFDQSAQKSDSMEVTADRARAEVFYMMTPELQVHGALVYGLAENRSPATAVTSAQTTQQKSGALQAGASYNKTYTPDFLGPFVFDTSYAFDYGFSEISSTDPSIDQGRGRFYVNSGGLGFTSRGWDKDTFSLGYGVTSKRDHSPANNDYMSQNFNLNVNTRRLPKTTIAASAYYAVHESTSAFSIQSIATNESNQQRRSVRYNINASHATTQSLTLNAGATRGLTTSNTVYTLASLSTPQSSVYFDETTVFAGAQFNYNFTRNVSFRANAQEEFRKTDNLVTKSNTRTHSANVYIDYRIRMILLNLEYRWKQDVPENGTTVTQQYFVALITRPF
jgi:hypothetical protein